MGQRAPTMNFGEKLLRSPYGRPFYQLITGKRVPKELYSDIHDVLVIDKGIIEACTKDIEHTFCCYEILQKQLHMTGQKNTSNLTEKLSSRKKN